MLAHRVQKGSFSMIIILILLLKITFELINFWVWINSVFMNSTCTQQVSYVHIILRLFWDYYYSPLFLLITASEWYDSSYGKTYIIQNLSCKLLHYSQRLNQRADVGHSLNTFSCLMYSLLLPVHQLTLLSILLLFSMLAACRGPWRGRYVDLNLKSVTVSRSDTYFGKMSV